MRDYLNLWIMLVLVTGFLIYAILTMALGPY